MERLDLAHPRSRKDGVLVEVVGYETVVYDEERKEAHSLNRSAAFVWKHCDGKHSVKQLATLLGGELGTDVTEPVVEYALHELSRANLLQATRSKSAKPVNRRDAIRRMSYASAAAIALPVVMSLVAPTPAMAASGVILPPDPGEDM